MPNGLLLIDKPEGVRSTDCVARVRRAFGKGVRVGHAGTLDSTASGLLVVLVGSATRLSDYVMRLPKVYRASVRLGAETDTCDRTGEVVFRGDAACVDEAAFDRILPSFWGMRMQRPPEISALKVNGEPSHRLARSGRGGVLPERPVMMESVRRRSALADGRVEIEVVCGRGTYIRSLARDIGARLGCGAHIEALRRLSIGPFRVSEALSDLSALASAPLRSPREAVAPFHRILLTERAEARILNGLPVPLREAGRYVPGTVGFAGGLCVEGAGMIGFADREVGEKEAGERGGGEILLRPRANISVRDEAEGT